MAFQLKASLQFLEPEYPFAQRRVTLTDNAINIILTNHTLTEEFTTQNMLKSLSKTYTFFTDPCNVISLLAEQTIVDNILAPLFDYIFPNNFFSKILSNEAMVFNARAFLYSKISNTNAFQLCKKLVYNRNLKFGNFKTQNLHYIKPILYLLTTCLSTLPVHVASCTNPTLFELYTFFNPLIVLPFKPYTLLIYIILSCSSDFKPKEIPLIPNLYSLHDLNTDINNIFNAKKILFLTCILLSCIYLKPNNTLFTKPEWWLSIGVTHCIWQKIMLSYKLEQKYLYPHNLPFNMALNTYVHNIIPISATILHTCYIHMASSIHGK